MAPKRPVRIGFVSTAHIHSRDFLKNVAERADAELTGVWDDVPERGRRHAGEFDTRFVDDLDALLDEDATDALIVCAETARHPQLLEQVLPVGRPTMCEKPLAIASADAERAVALARTHRVALISGYFQPFFAHHQAAARAVAEGRLGHVTHAVFRNAHHAAYGRWFDHPDLRWFTNPALAGGGALLDMGTHAIHLLLHLLDQRPRRIRGTTANVCGAYPDVEDWGTAEIEFDGGTRARAEAAWVATSRANNGLEIWGSEAGLIVRPGTGGKPAAVLTRPGKADEMLDPEAVAPRPERVDRLIASVRGELSADELERDLRACVDAVRVMEAAYASAGERGGAWVDLPPYA